MRQAEREMLAELPAMLDRVDALDRGRACSTATQLNAADYMIATSLALLTYRTDVEPGSRARPSAALVDRVLPDPERGGAGERSPSAAAGRPASLGTQSRLTEAAMIQIACDGSEGKWVNARVARLLRAARY